MNFMNCGKLFSDIYKLFWHGLVFFLVRVLGVVNLTDFGRDLKPGVNFNSDLFKQRINCWDCCIYFIVLEN